MTQDYVLLMRDKHLHLKVLKSNQLTECTRKVLNSRERRGFAVVPEKMKNLPSLIQQSICVHSYSCFNLYLSIFDPDLRLSRRKELKVSPSSVTITGFNIISGW